MLATGDPDLSFGGDGVVETGVQDRVPYRLLSAVQPDGKVVIATTMRYDTSVGDYNSELKLIRWNFDGSIDTTFGTNGTVLLEIPAITIKNKKVVADILASDIAFDSSGRIIVTGTATTAHDFKAGKPQSADKDRFVARFNANGARDASFGSAGFVTTNVGGDEISSGGTLAFQADGKIVVGATKADGAGGFNNAVVRYNINGSLDSTFDGDGIAVGAPETFNPVDLEIQGDGKIVVLGNGNPLSQTDPYSGFYFERYNSNGTRDTSFGNGGLVSLEVYPAAYAGTSSAPNRLAFDGNGNILAAGQALAGSGNIGVVRLLAANGALDPTFDGDGIVILRVSDVFTYDGVHGLRVQADGKILMGSVAIGGSAAPISLLRLNANGSLDSTYGTGGILPFDATAPVERSIIFTPDERIVMAGPQSRIIYVSRYLNDSPLLAAANGPGAPAGSAITAAMLPPIVAAAQARWQSLGVDPSRFAGLRVTTADLAGRYLGLASGSTITLNRDAAGWGWFVDATPRDDSEFRTAGNQGEQNRIDLLTVVMHEMGHVLGLGHDDSSDDVMYESLATATRRTPDADDALRAALAYWVEQFGQKSIAARRRLTQ
jgi:uncharacterized delta-60 repeat protein